MFHMLQVLSLLLVAVGMALSLAHALELPGKLRLGKEAYLATQTIYYPGFTIGGFFGEFGAMLATLVLLLLTPAGSAPFWLTLVALLALLIMHGLYWALTHPVNQFWLKDQNLRGAGSRFFAVGAEREPAEREWTALRDQWEYSHVARAALAMLSLIVLATATSL